MLSNVSYGLVNQVYLSGAEIDQSILMLSILSMANLERRCELYEGRTVFYKKSV
jgi:hypothetical protein